MEIGEHKRSLRARLSQLAPPTPEVRARVIEGLERWLVRRRPAVVVGFLGMDDEMDIAPLVDKLPTVTFALTRTAPGVSLTIHPYDAPRERHRFGFSQPSGEAPIIAADSVDVVLVPGLAFDRCGRRLGRGAGYYDRFLAGMEVDKVALTTEARLVDEVPFQPHDILMDWIATEKGVHSTRRD